MASETLGFLADLSNSGAKLLLYFERASMEENTVPEIMRICGIGSRSTYYKARNELVSLGLLGHVEGSTKTVLIGTKSGLPTSPKTVPVGVQKVDSGPKTVLPTSPKSVPVGKSWVELAADTDKLAGEGKREQAKRVVAEAWADMFPDSTVHANTVAQLLEFANWSCSDVLGAMVVTQENGIEASRVTGYVRKAVRNPVWKGKAKPAPEPDNIYDDPEMVERSYQEILRKFDKQTADEWRASLSA